MDGDVARRWGIERFIMAASVAASRTGAVHWRRYDAGDSSIARRGARVVGVQACVSTAANGSGTWPGSNASTGPRQRTWAACQPAQGPAAGRGGRGPGLEAVAERPRTGLPRLAARGRWAVMTSRRDSDPIPAHWVLVDDLDRRADRRLLERLVHWLTRADTGPAANLNRLACPWPAGGSRAEGPDAASSALPGNSPVPPASSVSGVGQGRSPCTRAPPAPLASKGRPGPTGPAGPKRASDRDGPVSSYRMSRGEA